MAQAHNAIKYQTGLLGGLALIAGVSREASGVERLGETLTPTIDAWSQPEFALPRGEIIAIQQGSAAAVPAESTAVALTNPAGSGLLVVLEAASAMSPAAATVAVMSVVVDTAVFLTLADAGPGIRLDRRQPIVPLARCRVQAGTDPGAIGFEIDRELTGGINAWAHFKDALPLILGPGQAVVIQDGTANQTFFARFRWRERHAVLGEILIP